MSDASLCKKCGGRGSVGQTVEDDDEVTVLWNFCETCNGTGFARQDDTFSLGGMDIGDDIDD